jgi:plastocyanin
MNVVRYSTALAVIASMSVGCGDASRPVEPASTLTQPTFSADKTSARSRPIKVDMLDKCDRTTFDAAIGPGTCTRRHGTTFARFIAELTANKSVRAWRNRPSKLEAEMGQRIVAFNRGGEVHTFTKVAEYGGGIVPLLNQLAGTPHVAPECLSLSPAEFVPPGGKDTEEPIATTGTVRFMCCIHPWMKTTVTVEQEEADHGEHGHRGS